jgi:hypothetical protein
VKLVPRLTSPVGFLLALVFLLLPFVAVSCDAPGLGSAEVSYTGLDLATGGQPSVTTEGELTRENGAPVPTADSAPRAGVQALAIITVALLVLGLVISLAPVLTVRRFGAMGAAVAAGTMLIVTQAVAQSHLKPDLILGLQRLLADKPGDLPATGTSVDDLVHSRFGFWLSLIAVLLVLLFNVGSLLWPRISALVRSTREPPPPQ